MRGPRRILILGASYGALLGTKLAAAGHHVTLVGLPNEVARINDDGCRLRLPVRGIDGLIEIHSRTLAGSIDAASPGVAEPARYDLVVLAMQEPQYRAPAIRRLLVAIAVADRPVLSVMNMPPLPFLKRIPSLDAAALEACYTDATVWDPLDPSRVTLCSPDPQAFRPPGEEVNVLQVRLATNFKAAPFERDDDNALLLELAESVEGVRYDIGAERVDLPVKLRVPGSIFVPMAKWCMLMAGNYRCFAENRIVSIRDAVHRDLAASRAVYDDVTDLCVGLGASRDDLVPFEKYANAALSLESPSSVARALAAGATHIERVDRLVATIAEGAGRPLFAVYDIVARVDTWLTRNRAEAA
ncbi:MAG: hypothetical protein KJ587_15235 [Alphaproteobacteria bacterium]|nr:hypothetical protein [Alphaproteobacteria bacterium]